MIYPRSSKMTFREASGLWCLGLVVAVPRGEPFRRGQLAAAVQWAEPGETRDYSYTFLYSFAQIRRGALPHLLPWACYEEWSR